MKTFDIPDFYRSSFISAIKNLRKKQDPKKKSFTPALADFGPVRFLIPRHFGFCYGVENAIEISYRAIEENPEKRIFLLSQMIHNPQVNADLQQRGIRFLMDTNGNELMPMEELQPEDIVIIPAFGTTIDTEQRLKAKGIQIEKYNTTCPFVERVWKKSEKLAEDQYSIIIHGKHKHEETRATFSHSSAHSPSVVIKDMADAEKLADIILGKKKASDFYTLFSGKFSDGFDVEKHLLKIGVVNQTTMLASETQAIAEFLKKTMESRYGSENLKDHFADTRDTLCYATNDNQDATYGLLEAEADMAIVVGGYNSSNTSHLVELLETKFPTFFIEGEETIVSRDVVRHFNIHTSCIESTSAFLPAKGPVTIALTSGASCPDIVVERVAEKLLSFFEGVRNKEEVLASLQS